MSNLLYRCSLNESLQFDDSDEPHEVLLRLYGPSFSGAEIQVEIFNQLAVENLGPRLYAHFNEGRFEQYLESSPLKSFEMIDEGISKIIAKKVAAIHKLNVKKLVKDPNWLISYYKKHCKFIDSLKERPIIFDKDTLETTKAIAEELLSIDYMSEIEYLESLLRSSKAPLVFSHNDLHQNNILLLHDTDKDLDERVVLIDFEYCSYNYRPFDAANHLSEWCFDYCTDTYPFHTLSLDLFPSDEQQKRFLSHYIQESDDSSSDNSNIPLEARIDELHREMQPFFLASNLLWTLWAITSARTSKINFGYWVSYTT